MQLIDAREYDAAIARLRALLEQTKSPRVQLELARALFLNRQYPESRRLFREVLVHPDTPWRVRENIEAFIKQIDEIEGYVRFGLSIVHDSNPLNITNQREFTIGGFRLTFQPPPNEPVTGLRYLVQVHQPLLAEQRLALYATGSFIDYPGGAFDRATVDGGFAKGLADGRALAKLGIEAGGFANRLLYTFPYAAGDVALHQSSTSRVIVGAKAGPVRFRDFSYLDALYRSATLTVGKAATQQLALSLKGTIERSEAYESPYSYDGRQIVPGFVFLMNGPPLVIGVNAFYGTRDYHGEDPLFGIKRFDRRYIGELSLQNREWRWRDFKATLLLSVEENRSNIEFYSYRKVNVSIALD